MLLAGHLSAGTFVLRCRQEVAKVAARRVARRYSVSPAVAATISAMTSRRSWLAS